VIYQHTTRERDEAIAMAMEAALTRARKANGKSRSGTQDGQRLVMLDCAAGESGLSWAFTMERATGIEPAWPAWKVYRARPSWALTCTFRWPPQPGTDH
jgi:hypothetical protein